MEYTELPTVEVSFILSSRKIGTTEITDLIQISPTTERSIDEWPDTIKNNTNLPEELKPRNEWSWTARFHKCMSVDEALADLINQFQEKITEIVEITERFSVEKSVTVLIHANSNEMPEVGLESKAIEFLNCIKSPIYFDIYTY